MDMTTPSTPTATTSTATDSVARNRLPALQAPLKALGSLQSSEFKDFVGICTSRLTSRVLALPDRGEAHPCTISISGPGILHVLDGTLRIAKEGAAKEMQLSEGAFMLVKDSDRRLVAGRASRPSSVAVRFLWVEVR